MKHILIALWESLPLIALAIVAMIVVALVYGIEDEE